jgi:hypothetical protein
MRWRRSMFAVFVAVFVAVFASLAPYPVTSILIHDTPQLACF